jgi:hypothetical protein
MATERASELTRRVLLAVFVVILAVVLYREMMPGAGSSPGAPRPANRPAGQPGSTTGVAAPDVHLRSLNGERPEPENATRNLFRFKPKAPPPRATAPPPSAAPPPRASGPPGPPPLPPIALKFIGVIEVTTEGRKIAGFVDPQGHTYGGGEGDIIAGQYKILRIGAESIEMAYLDGRGRQTIRLSGS